MPYFPTPSGGAAVIPATQSSAGIVRQTVFHVKDFGSTGTSDDSSAFSSAIAAAQAVNGTVFAPAGIYTCAPMTTSPAPFSMIGDGMYKTVIKLKSGTNGWLFTFGDGSTECDSIALDNLCLHGNGANQTTGGGCINAPYAVHHSYTRARFTSSWDVSVWLQGQQTGGTSFGHNNNITGCLIDNGRDVQSAGGTGQGLRLNSNDENFIFASDLTYNGTVAGGSNSFAIMDGSGTNYFVGVNFVGGQSGYKMNSAPNSRLVGCHFDGVGGHAIELGGTGAAITGCTISKPSQSAANIYSAIHLAFAGGGHTIVGNQYTGSKTTDATVYHADSFYREQSPSLPSTVVGNTIINGETTSGYVSFANGIIRDAGLGTTYRAVQGWPDSRVHRTYATKTASYTLGSLDDVVEVGASGTTMTLPTAVGLAGQIYTILNNPSGASTTIATTASQTINGASTYTLSAAYSAARLLSNGANWILV